MASRPTSYPLPASWRVVLLAGCLDQLAFLGIVILGIGAGLQHADTSGGSGASVAVGTGIGVIGALICLVVQTCLAVRHGTTAGLFLLGIRFDPRRQVHWFDDAIDWLLSFWRNVVLAPMVWLVNKVSRPGDEQDPGFVPDARARSGGGRLTRAVLALVLLLTPLPFVIAVLA